MRLSRTDLVPGLTIIAGGALGFSLAVGILATSLVLQPRSDDVPAPTPVVSPPATDNLAPQIPPALKEPVFTPMTIRPEIRNRAEVQQALMRLYPPRLRDDGIGGRVVLWFFISEEGRVLDRRVSRSSGHEELDEAALNVADVFRFTPAMDSRQILEPGPISHPVIRYGEVPVPVWIQLPITFQAQN